MLGARGFCRRGVFSWRVEFVGSGLNAMLNERTLNDDFKRSITHGCDKVLCGFEYRSKIGAGDGAVVEHSPSTQASHQCGPGSILGLGVKCRLSLLLVLVLVPGGFSPGTFPLPSKTNISTFQFDLEFEGHKFVSDNCTVK